MSYNSSIANSFNLSQTHLISCAQKVFFATHVITHTYSLTCILTFSSSKGHWKHSLQNSLMFHLIRFYPGWSFVHSKQFTSLHQETLFLILIIYFSFSISTCILTSSDSTLSRDKGFVQLHSVHILYQSPIWSGLLPSNLRLNVTSSSHD